MPLDDTNLFDMPDDENAPDESENSDIQPTGEQTDAEQPAQGEEKSDDMVTEGRPQKFERRVNQASQPKTQEPAINLILITLL